MTDETDLISAQDGTIAEQDQTIRTLKEQLAEQATLIDEMDGRIGELEGDRFKIATELATVRNVFIDRIVADPRNTMSRTQLENKASDFLIAAAALAQPVMNTPAPVRRGRPTNGRLDWGRR